MRVLSLHLPQTIIDSIRKLSVVPHKKTSCILSFLSIGKREDGRSMICMFQNFKTINKIFSFAFSLT